MNYSLGCSFSFKDLIYNFPFKSLKFTCDLCEAIVNDRHRDKLIRKIFLFNLKQVLTDVVENNVTFHLPLNGTKKCNIHMRTFTGEAFKNLRRHGKWKNVDIVNSMFTGYMPSLYMLGNRTPRVKSIYLNKLLRDRITEKTNQGMNYGDSKYDTTINDYKLQVYDEFPSILKLDIDRILGFCWKSVYLHNSYGGDLLLTNKDVWCYFGNLKKKPLDHFYYYIRKLTIKIRVLYKRKKIKWDGYYYFALTNTQYKKYLELKHKRGRPRKRFNYGIVCLYQIYDECRINEHQCRYIFKVPYISTLKLRKLMYDFTSDRAELVETREPLKFKDIMVYENEYEFI